MNKGSKLFLGLVFGLIAAFAYIGVGNIFDTFKANKEEAAVQRQLQREQLAKNQVETVPTLEQTVKEELDTEAPKASTAAEEKLDLQLIEKYGALQLTLGNSAAPNHIANGQFVISNMQGKEVATMKNTNTASFDLSPGIYEVMVLYDGKKSARMVEIVESEFLTEHFDLPTNQTTQQASQAVEQKPTESVVSSIPVVQQAQPPSIPVQTNKPSEAEKPTIGKLLVSVLTADSKVPLKADIYVQKPNGTHITKRSYTEYAEIPLRPGAYKVTVKTKGKQGMVKNIKVLADNSIKQLFLMESLAKTEVVKNDVAVEGMLTMMLRSPQNTPSKGRFVVKDAKGNRVARMRGVSNAEVMLKPGQYMVTAIHKRARLSKVVSIAKGSASQVIFDVKDFPKRAQTRHSEQPHPPQNTQQVKVPNKKGVLQLIAVSGVDQKPLKVNFKVSTLKGKRLKTVTNVSVTELTLPPQDVLVDIAYEEMRGRERVTVKAGQPTVFTFTISPDINHAAALINQFQQQAPRRLEEVLVERLQQELTKHLNR